MTSVLGETDVDWLELIDYEKDSECESKIDCGGTAEYSIIRSCCNFSFCVCRPCLEKLKAARPNNPDAILFLCEECRKEVSYNQMVWRIVPI